ncbi:M20/M25/M40 family metallo-hydrolase [Halobium salinum]|uniref:M20/M25/M40 family metallo-hydrolase n=1 Tax=Halobium salinum TaxID=1364940 RepID=A0ABD5PDI7_9EURY|nr:M20/M25/M40 family metallo-hydrolase [Halobium salinum]
MSSDSDPAGRTDTGFDPVSFLNDAVPVASDEDVAEMRELLVDTLERHSDDAALDADVAVDDAGNVVASRGAALDDLGGPGDPDTAGSHVVLNTHVDTVTPHVAHEYDGDAGVIRGRGSCDAKGPLAALLTGFLSVDPGDDRVTLAVTPDEETLSTGAHALVTDPDGPLSGLGDRDGDAVLVGEPTGLDVCTAAKGRFEGTVHLSGVNAHAAEAESGANAVAALEGVLAAVREFDAERDPHPELGPASLTPTVVSGGDATNQVPADCALTLDRRSVPPETADGFRESLLVALRDAAPEEVGVDFAFTERDTPFLEAFATDRDAPVVRALADAAEGVSDRAGRDCGAVRPFGAATEASYFADLAPTVVFGPGDLADDEGAVAHADREYVRVAEVEAAAEAVTAALRSLVGG